MDRWTPKHHQEALDHVARIGHLAIAKLLIEAGANEDRIRGAFMIAEPNVAEYLLEQCDDPQPDIGLIAYLGKWEAREFWFDRGTKPKRRTLQRLLWATFNAALCSSSRQRQQSLAWAVSWNGSRFDRGWRRRQWTQLGR